MLIERDKRDEKIPNITCAAIDIGGVLLSNGWDHDARKCAADHFSLDLDELNERHHFFFGAKEIRWGR
jgi:putative hydrolase of the HAD superfamily